MGTTQRPVLVYLDTCIVSGLARNDLTRLDAETLIKLLSRSSNGVVEFVTSAVALSELEKIPKKYQIPHLAVYHLLRKVQALPEPSLTRLAPSATPMANPNRRIWLKIQSILPDENDVKHVYQSINHHIDYFATVDESTILKYKSVLAVEVGVCAVRPSDLLVLLSIDPDDAK